MTDPLLLLPRRQEPMIIQRVMRPIILFDKIDPPPDARGLDRQFVFDYMGRAEFEWGALTQAADRMLEKIDNLAVHACTHVRGNAHFWYWVVSTPDLRLQAMEYFADFVEHRDGSAKHSKEPLWMNVIYGVSDQDKLCEIRTANDYFHRLVGWWALDAMVPWLIFKSEAEAEMWFTVMKSSVHAHNKGWIKCLEKD